MNHFIFRFVVATLLGLSVLAACAPLPKDDKKGDSKPIVFPAPPDEPRFTYERTIYGSADVTTRKSESQLKQALTGVGETSEGLGKPYAVAVHRGRIMVTDSADRFVRVFDIPAGKYYKLGEDEAGPLVKPLGIDVDNAGTVYVADATAKTVMVYDLNGKFQRKIGGPKQFDRLSSVTVDPEGKRIYVVDIGGVSSEHHRVRVFDAVTGAHVFDIGKRGTGKGEFNLPRDVALGKDGRIYVVDGGNFRIQVFDASGKYLQAFGSIGKQLGNFARPKEIASDAEGNVYVVDAAFGNFQIFNGDGDLLMYAGERSERDGPARYMLPSGVYVDEDGRVYLVDQWFRKVDIYRPVTLPAEGGYLGRRPIAPSK
jgi:DNA-binding beta-propeller fold protein YncE